MVMYPLSFQDRPHDLDIDGREGEHAPMSIGSKVTPVNAMMEFLPSANVELASVAAALLVLLVASDGTHTSIRILRDLQTSPLATSHLAINFRCSLRDVLLPCVAAESEVGADGDGQMLKAALEEAGAEDEVGRSAGARGAS